MSADLNAFQSSNVIALEDRLGGRQAPGPPLEPPGGGGGDMEARVKRLEEDVREIRADVRSILVTLGDIKTSLAGLIAKVDGLPTSKEYAGVAAKVSELPSGQEFGALKARLERLPTSGKVLTYLGILTAFVTLALRWTDVVTMLRSLFGS